MTQQPLLSVNNLGISTLQDPRILVNNVSFDINPGEAVGVVGESGSGKESVAQEIHLHSKRANQPFGSKR